MRTALLLEVPQAEPLVGHLRAEYDPSAKAGMPAHVTLLVPFMPFSRIDDAVRRELRALFAASPCIEMRFAATRRFPDVLWLAPDDPGSIAALIGKLIEAFPDYPPYGGAYDGITPHLTLAHNLAGASQVDLDRIDAAFLADARADLPIIATVREVAMYREEDQRWRRTAEFALAPG
jgi:hypothetical protein